MYVQTSRKIKPMFHVQDIFFLSENVPVRFYPSVGDPDPPGFKFFAVSGHWFVMKSFATKFMTILKPWDFFY